MMVDLKRIKKTIELLPDSGKSWVAAYVLFNVVPSMIEELEAYRKRECVTCCYSDKDAVRPKCKLHYQPSTECVTFIECAAFGNTCGAWTEHS